LKPTELTKQLGAEWKALSEDEKAVWFISSYLLFI
jgi:hypothetical protein